MGKRREKWDKSSTPPEFSDGQPVAQKITYVYDTPYKPKLLLKSPSLRAMRNYNNLSIIDNSQNNYDNLSFIPENGNIDLNTYNDAYTSTLTSNDSKQSYPNLDPYDYTTLGTASIRTTASNNGSELGSEKNEMGSTAKLVSPKMGMVQKSTSSWVTPNGLDPPMETTLKGNSSDHLPKMAILRPLIMSCQTWFTHLETILCTVSLAAGFGNLYRLPQITLQQGGLPFLVAYVILTILIGLPLLFLELGIGQLAQEGFIKSWRAVPFFRGIGYVKLIAGCVLGIYYPLYMGLALYYIIWIAAKPVPFTECVHVTMNTNVGYVANGTDGQQCLKKTFLLPPYDDGFWYGIFAAILFVIWVVITILSIRRTKSFIKSMSLLLFPVLGCMIALTIKAVSVENKFESLEKLDIDWGILGYSYTWYYAAIQVFYSTNVGFGTFITNAGIIYTKSNPLVIALGFIVVNLVFGIGSVMICYIISGEVINGSKGNYELHLMAFVYTVLVKSENKADAEIWAIVAYAAVLLAGFISMATITYTLLKAITVQNRRRLKWWQTSIVMSFIGLILGCAVLLKPEFQLVRLLDHYIVGNLIIISVIIEVFALIAFYGTERIKSDFEFMLGHILSNIWLLLWWFLPLLLTGIFAWALITLPPDIFIDDPEWLSGTGWAIVLTAAIFIFVIGFHTVTKQDGYTTVDKFKASLKPSHKWGPKDPILRHTWIQWNSKAKQGERDFTLKRRGTREYARSVKKNAKKATITPNSDSTIKSDQNQNNRISNGSAEYAEPYYVVRERRTDEIRTFDNQNVTPYRVTSLVDSLDPPTPTINVKIRNTFNGGFTTNINPLARTHKLDTQESSTSEGYGTFRKGPYIIPETDNVTHVCHRRYSQSEDATEL